MKTITRRGILATSIFVMMVASATAQPYGGRGNCRMQCMRATDDKRPGIENIIPDLTEDQKAALKELGDAHFIQMKEIKNQMGEISARQRTIMSADPIDQKAAGKLIDQKTELMNKQMKIQLAHKAAVKEVLSDEQVLAMEQMSMRRPHANQNCPSGRGPRGPFCPNQAPNGVKNL